MCRHTRPALEGRRTLKHAPRRTARWRIPVSRFCSSAVPEHADPDRWGRLSPGNRYPQLSNPVYVDTTDLLSPALYARADIRATATIA